MSTQRLPASFYSRGHCQLPVLQWEQEVQWKGRWPHGLGLALDYVSLTFRDLGKGTRYPHGIFPKL